MNFQEFCVEAEKIDKQIVQAGSSVVISFRRPDGSAFNIDPSDIVFFLQFMANNHEICKRTIEEHSEFNKASYTNYQEDPYRALYKSVGGTDELKTIKSLGGSQTNQLTKIISKFVCFLAEIPYSQIEENTHFDLNSINSALANTPKDLNSLITHSRATHNIDAIRLAFQKWLSAKNLADKTVREYSDTVINCADKLLLSNFVNGNSLYHVDSYESAAKLIEKLEKNPVWIKKNSSGNSMYQAGINKYAEFLREYFKSSNLPKPFILLAGISGTGKTRFVREQAAATNSDAVNYCLIPVRPDWHEPSDLLGYVSRIGEPHYVVTDLLCFIVAAWKDAMSSASVTAIQNKAPAEMTPYWLCLDEMNLAPVEQYFADFLSVLETRKWSDSQYSCAPILKADSFNKSDIVKNKLRADLNLSGKEYDGLWAYFTETGIPLPPNLIVAGTVNMDETTHGFSRKVIDRAFTIDFGAFYPNDFAHYFDPATTPKTLSFPHLSSVAAADLEPVAADPDGQKSIVFLNAINAELKNTPFELAFRALNELLISLVCFQPKTPSELQAVWDDFLMTKVLPRIDGDSHKLGESDQGSLLTRLATIAQQQLKEIWHDKRPDLLRENTDKSELAITCRSKQKLAWMGKRLTDNGFTSFWP